MRLSAARRASPRVTHTCWPITDGRWLVFGSLATLRARPQIKKNAELQAKNYFFEYDETEVGQGLPPVLPTH